MRPFHATAPRAWRSFERSSRYENMGRPKIANKFELHEKCAVEILIRVRTSGIKKITECRQSPAEIVKTPIVKQTITNKNSSKRRRARGTALGKRRMRFFVHPSRSWRRPRYIRVRTASPP